MPAGKYTDADLAPPAEATQDAPQGNSGFFGPIQDAYDSAVAKSSAEDEQSMGHLGRGLRNFGRGALEVAEPLMHPIKTAQQAQTGEQGKSGLRRAGEALAGPAGMAAEGLYHMGKGAVQDVQENGWEDALPHIGGQIAGTYLAGKVAPEVGADAVDAIPRMGRAGRTLAEIQAQAKDVPVPMNQTAPALDQYRQSVATGGNNRAVMSKFMRRLDGPNAQPMNFPEARDFYSNISTATAKPGLLRGAIESPGMPKFRMNAGNVRSALSDDLTNAASSIGRGEDYTNAMKEYRQAAQVKDFIKKAALIGGGAAAAAVPGGSIIKRLTQ